ncbi:hypothetical protein BC826DRAFT_1101910 [Russula brevipes]|nr:hypothetical protein BC826DRAFT_1101910 [Russula brevipes]
MTPCPFQGTQPRSAYYKLSKQFHPDINKEPEAREKFLAFSDAYASLETTDNDDRTTVPSPRPAAAPTAPTGPSPPPTPLPSPPSVLALRERERGAAPERELCLGAPPPTSPGLQPTPLRHYARSQQHPSASSDPHGRRADPHTLHYRPPRTDWKDTELGRVNRVSGLGRAAQLVALFVAVAVVGTLGKS